MQSKKNFYCLILLLLPPTLFGSPLLIISEDLPYQATFIQHLQTANKQYVIKKVSLKNLSTEKIEAIRPLAIISLSRHISEKLLSLKLNIPTLHTLSTRSNLDTLINCLPLCKKQLPLDYFLILDQPALRQLRLARLIKPNAKNIAILVTDKSLVSAQLLQSGSASTAMNLHVYKTSARSLGFQLDEISRTSDIILAIADTDIFNTSTLPQILLTSYRHQTPVIGFSKGFVKAGAIAAVISDMPQIAAHAMGIIDNLHTLPKKNLASLHYPKYYRVISNKSVARSLFLIFPDDDKLTSLLKTHETAN